MKIFIFIKLFIILEFIIILNGNYLEERINIKIRSNSNKINGIESTAQENMVIKSIRAKRLLNENSCYVPPRQSRMPEPRVLPSFEIAKNTNLTPIPTVHLQNLRHKQNKDDLTLIENIENKAATIKIQKNTICNSTISNCLYNRTDVTKENEQKMYKIIFNNGETTANHSSSSNKKLIKLLIQIPIPYVMLSKDINVTVLINSQL